MLPTDLTSALFGIALLLTGIALAVVGLAEWSSRTLWLTPLGVSAATFGGLVLYGLTQDDAGYPSRRNRRR